LEAELEAEVAAEEQRRKEERAQWLEDHENESDEERRAREYRNHPRWGRFGQ
jgi:hypothetical protein